MFGFFWDTIEAANIALDSLRANKVRAALATLGIVIGVMTVILMVNIIQGLTKSFKEQLASIGTGTVYVAKYPWIIQDDFFIYRNRPNITMRDYEAVQDQCRLASAVAPLADTVRPVAFGSESLQNVYMIGTSDRYLETSDVMPEAGRFISSQDYSANRPVAVIGTTVAERLFRSRNPIGQKIRIGAHEYLVIGVLEKQGTMFGFSMDTQIIIPLGTMLKHFGRRRDLNIIVKAADASQLEDLKDELRGILRRSRRVEPSKSDDFSINEQGQLMGFYTQITSGVYAAGIIIGGISLLVGGIGIMNIMLVSVTERTHEIGIRKALGARKSQILRQFIIESAFICALGGIIGVGFAFGGGKIINQFLPTTMTPAVAIGGMIFAALVGVFFGFYPAAKAAKLDPIIALRKE
ncbi:MAG TPA: ABC transporter permease [bacterium]|jgi:putative ABC transport system permease protein